jgi:hypothetical protein
LLKTYLQIRRGRFQVIEVHHIGLFNISVAFRIAC